MKHIVQTIPNAVMPRFERGSTTWVCLLDGMLIPAGALALIPEGLQ